MKPSGILLTPDSQVFLADVRLERVAPASESVLCFASGTFIRRAFMLKRILLFLGMLGLSGCTSNGPHAGSRKCRFF